MVRLRHILHALLGLALWSSQAFAVRYAPKPKKARPADEDDSHKLWHWIEDHLEIVFPVVGVTVIVLVLWGVRRGMAQANDSIAVRTRQKEEIVRLMRSKLMVNADTVAHELNFDRFHAAALLEELQKEGVLVAGRMSGGVASYRLKGL